MRGEECHWDNAVPLCVLEPCQLPSAFSLTHKLPDARKHPPDEALEHAQTEIAHLRQLVAFLADRILEVDPSAPLPPGAFPSPKYAPHRPSSLPVTAPSSCGSEPSEPELVYPAYPSFPQPPRSHRHQHHPRPTPTPLQNVHTHYSQHSHSVQLQESYVPPPPPVQHSQSFPPLGPYEYSYALAPPSPEVPVRFELGLAEGDIAVCGGGGVGEAEGWVKADGGELVVW